jgi:TatA/E family protein of Tat protein translocase
MFGSVGVPEILVVLGVILFLFFGVKRLPMIARGLGGAIRRFREEVTNPRLEPPKDS